MAGLDKVDPADLCLHCRAAYLHAFEASCMTAEWFLSLIAKCQRACWIKQPRWPEMPCIAARA
jgi:hypothetical protein